MARHPLYRFAAWAIGLLMIALFPSAAWAFEVRVCVRPPGVGADVGKWFWNYENKLKTVMGDEGAFRVKSRDHIVFVYDPWAPPESANHFRGQWPKITCPKPPTPPNPAAAPPPPKPPPPAQPPPKKEEKPKEAGPPAGSGGKPPTAEELARRARAQPIKATRRDRWPERLAIKATRRDRWPERLAINTPSNDRGPERRLFALAAHVDPRSRLV